MHDIVKEGYSELFPEKEHDFEGKIMYSRAFKGYNAKVKYTKSMMEFRLSYPWKEVSEEIQIGLIQSLLNKIYKTNIKTINIELYDIFIKKIPSFTPKTKSDPMLEDSFNRINAEYFDDMLELPNLEFAGINFRTLGTYDHGTDTIRISDVLKKELMLMDYVMYHEMLHKRLKFKSTGKRNMHHSRQFRDAEKKFRVADVEKKLSDFLRKEKFRQRFWFN